ncbi:MAG: uracil-DNA glycosylase [Deltaproteobacteria bacterium]|nr:uracil-DNA glycosylase [Deltaproteobacteria bacterium]
MEKLNEDVRACEGCRLFLTRTHPLYGEGNLNARLLLVALSPGSAEDLLGRMFIGPSGRVLDQLLNVAGVHRDSIYMTNLIKCMLPKNRRPKMEEIESCRHFLEEEIAIIHPGVIVPLGYYATRTILTKYHADPPSARKDYPGLYGTLIFSDGQKIFPVPHPATLLYNPAFEPGTAELYKQLSVLSRDCKWYLCCPMKFFYEEGRLERRWIELYCKGLWHRCIRYHMEERGEYHPDWMLPDGTLDQRLAGI